MGFGWHEFFCCAGSGGAGSEQVLWAGCCPGEASTAAHISEGFLLSVGFLSRWMGDLVGTRGLCEVSD